jgi:hypothetical protein
VGVRHGIGAWRNAGILADALRRRAWITMAAFASVVASGRTDMDSVAPNATAGGAPASSKLVATVIALLVNAVPLVGVLYFDWSAINVVVLYWFENLLIAIGTTLRLVVHRALTRKRGYWNKSKGLGIQVNNKPVDSGLITAYMIGAFGFTFAHGIFIGFIVLITHENYPDQPMWQISFDQVRIGALAIAAMLGAELLIDLTRIRNASFAAMEEYATSRMSRIVVMHLTIIFGMFLMMLTNSPMYILYVLIALKTIVDLHAISIRGTRQPSRDGKDEETMEPAR